MLFPYAVILKRAYDLARNNFQVWVFGIFVSFSIVLQFLVLNLILDWREIVEFSLPVSFAKFWALGQSPWLLSNLGALLVILLVSALCKACLIWIAQKLTNREPVNLKTTLDRGSQFIWQVLALQIFLLAAFLVLFGFLALPVVYLVTLKEIGRTLALTVLGVAILVPASIMLGFLFLYSPVAAVLYKLSFRSSLVLAFQLVQTKLKESLVMAAFLAGIWLAFMMLTGFGIIVLSVPVAFLSLVLAKLGLPWAIYVLIFGTGFLGLCALVTVSAGFAVFNNFVWVMTVMEMVKTEKHGETAKALAPEAEPVS